MSLPEEHRTVEGTTREEPRSVAPGALSALLQDLARGPEMAAGVSPSWPHPGTIIGRFELLREIGRGGFGVVYEARDEELHRSVAFKLVRPGRPAMGADQLRREADIIARLSHPNLVTLFDVGRCEHGPYLVLEYLRGETLQARLRQGALEVVEGVRVACEIAKGLAHAHGQGIVHRDLKPSNVFVCEGGQVKLLDFGLAHAFGWRRLEGGTPGYMAPEHWRGAPEDERTDVFALGVILFQMLAGQLPFPHDEESSSSPHRRAPRLEVPGHPALAELAGRMLENDPTKRPRDAGEALVALCTIQKELEGAAPAGPVRTTRGQVRTSRALTTVLLAAAVAIGAATWAGLALRHEGRAAPPRARAIAVLPFSNMSQSPDSEYFSDGLTEEILNLLTRVRELKVAASTSSFKFKDRKVDVADVAERLRVDVVLVGTVRREKEHLRVGAELVDARSGFRVWSQIYDRRLEDVFAIQDEIARQVVGALAIVLSPASESELSRPPTTNVAAYELYLRARGLLRLPSSSQHLDQATALFQQAIAADGAFAQAYAGLCEAWLARYELERAADSFDRAEKACRTALDRDRDSVEVYVALGNLHRSSGKYGDAEREFRHASTLSRTAVDPLLGLARTYAAQRRLDDAEKALAQAERLDPGDWRLYQELGLLRFDNGRHGEAAAQFSEVIARTPDSASAYNNVGAAYYMAGDFERAAKAWRQSLALAPTGGAYSNVGFSYFFLGRFEEAAAMYAKALEVTPEDHRLWGNLGDASSQVPGRAAQGATAYAKAIALGEERLRVNPADAETMAELAHFHARLGHADRARLLARAALQRDPENNQVRYFAALVSVQLGEVDSALTHLERAVALGYQRQLLPVDPGLATLRQNGRFAALVAPPAK